MATTTTGNVNAGVDTYYDKRFLRVLEETMRIVPLGQKRNLPKGSGKTVQFFQWNKIPVTLTTGVVDSKITTEGTNPSATTLTGINKNVTLVEYGDFSKHTRILKRTHIDVDLKGTIPLWGQHAAEVLDLVTQQEIVSRGAMPVRADLDSTYMYSGTVTTATSATSLADTGLSTNTSFGDANDDLNQSVIYFTSGKYKGTGGTITDYVTASGTMTIAGLETADGGYPAVGDTFNVVGPNGLSSATASNADSLNTSQIRRGMRLLKTYDAMPMDSDGFFVGVLSPETEEGLMADTNWTNVSQYSAEVEGRGGGLFKGEVGKWGGVRWVRTTVPFKFAIEADGTAGTGGGPGAAGINYSAASYAVGAGITCSYIFGKESFGTVQFDGFGGSKGSDSRPRIIIKSPGPGDTSEPLNLNSTAGWYAAFAPKMLQPLNCVQLWSAEPQL